MELKLPQVHVTAGAGAQATSSADGKEVVVGCLSGTNFRHGLDEVRCVKGVAVAAAVREWNVVWWHWWGWWRRWEQTAWAVVWGLGSIVGC